MKRRLLPGYDKRARFEKKVPAYLDDRRDYVGGARKTEDEACNEPGEMRILPDSENAEGPVDADRYHGKE